MSSNKYERTAAMFELGGTPTGNAPARFDYGGRVQASDQNTDPAGFHVWHAQLEAHPNSSDPRRFWCQQECAACAGGPPCTIVIKPLATGDKHVAIGTDVSLVNVSMGDPATQRAELHFAKNANQRIPVFTSDEDLPAQLQVWHRDAFGSEQKVVYHVYKLVAPVVEDDKLNGLNDTLIAIPIKPRGEPKP